MKFIRYFIFVPFWVLCLSSALFGREIDSQNRESPEQEQDFSYDRKDIYNPSQKTPSWTLQDLMQQPQNLNQILQTFSQDSIEPAGRPIDDLVPIPPPNLEEWLEERPQIANAIIWVDETGERNWRMWNASKKNSLREAFETFWNWYENNGQRGTVPIPRNNPPPNQWTRTDEVREGLLRTYLSPQDAWDLHRAYVANSLVLEITGRLGWSINTYSERDLKRLLDVQSIFFFDAERNQYLLQPISNLHGRRIISYDAIPAPPPVIFSFIRTHRMLGSSRLETITRLFDWGRENLVHAAAATPDYRERIWGYRGSPPVSVIISGTLDLDQAITPGCWGTAALLNSILRAVNIPSEVVNVGDRHSKLFLSSENLYLLHGDHLYDPFVYSIPPLPIQEILVNGETFENWFVRGMPQNMDRRLHEVTVQYLPEYLLMNHCRDLVERRNHDRSRVLRLLSPTYSLVQLESEDPTRDLWSRIDAKIAAMGGCHGIPNPFPSDRAFETISMPE